MKKHIILILMCIGLSAIFISSCENYLDKAPVSTFTEDEVFSNYNNFMKYFDAIYKGQPGYNSNSINYLNSSNIFVSFPLYLNGIPRAYSMDQVTDLCDGGWIRENQAIKAGNMGNYVGFYYDQVQQRPQMTTMCRIIRICNTALKNVERLKDVPQQEIDDIIAQAHFCRAFAHFAIFRFWGGFPYITNVIGAYDDWDLPRLSRHETCLRIVADLDTAVTFFEKANRMRRDNPVVGGVGHLDHPDLFRPNGVTAKAIKGRVLLYAASPINNELGAKDWEEAAKANWDAIQTAEQYGYFLLNAANYKQNWIGVNYSDEALWSWAAGPVRYNDQLLRWLIGEIFQQTGDRSGDNPTQGTIDRFETKWGDPLNTQEDRDAATALGHYNEQNLYVDRDPRFYIDILYNQAPFPGYVTAEIWTENVGGVIQYSELLDPKRVGVTKTGYYERKLWGENSVKNDYRPIMTDPFIRLGELYLNYAEAANEAYGPNTPAPGANLSAVQAINVIRQRIGHVDVQSQFTTNKDIFRPRIKNERIVELAFEGQYWFDERRWMDAPVWMSQPMMGMDIQKVPVREEYPIGFKHTRVPIPANRQCAWKDEMYWFPFLAADYYKMKNFDCSLNPRW